MYTSGSTGLPKGVMIEHRGIANYVQAVIVDRCMSEADRQLQVTSIGFDVSLGEILPALCVGASLHPFPQSVTERRGALRDFIDARGITAIHAAPSLLQTVDRAGESLRVVEAGGEPCTPAMVARWSPGRCFLNGYGPTEATVGVSSARLDHGTPITVGRPHPNVRLYVVDRDLEPCPIGATGEIVVGGVQVGRGYLGRPDLTAEVFLADPFSEEPGGQLYKTGDIGRWRADGTLECLGRVDEQIKIRGVRLEPGEVEATLCRHPSVKHCAIVPRNLGTPGASLDAYVVPDDASDDVKNLSHI
jgi:amino acid adenylation domain-containing protein